MWCQSAVSWKLCHASITTPPHESNLHLFPLFHHPLLSVFSLFFSAMTVNSLLQTLAETRTIKTVMCCVNHLLSLANQPLLGECVTNCASLVIFTRKVTNDIQCASWCYSKCKGFHHWTIGSIIVLLNPNPNPNPGKDNDLTDVYLHEHFWDYFFKAILITLYDNH